MIDRLAIFGATGDLAARYLLPGTAALRAAGHLDDGFVLVGAGLDDIEEEPAKQRDWKPEIPSFSLDNVIITPHAAYYSEEAIRTVRDFAAREVVRVLTGKPPLSPVNAAELAIDRPLR
jgi:D-3-phosphoglycerate dehydrogenase / 2-oxoglutarate reductase